MHKRKVTCRCGKLTREVELATTSWADENAAINAVINECDTCPDVDTTPRVRLEPNVNSGEQILARATTKKTRKRRASPEREIDAGALPLAPYGRPPTASRIKTITKTTNPDMPKRGRGRPKGSVDSKPRKNARQTPLEPKEPKKRGRPLGSKNKPKV